MYLNIINNKLYDFEFVQIKDILCLMKHNFNVKFTFTILLYL